MGKRLSEAERGYLAGFLDADGAIMAIIERHQEKKFGFRVRIILKISQQDKKILRWFKRKLGFGTITKNRSTFDWLLKDQKLNHALLSLLLPYLKVKSQQAKKAIKILEKPINNPKDLLKAASLADSLSRFNVRSRNRRRNFASMIQESLSCND